MNETFFGLSMELSLDSQHIATTAATVSGLLEEAPYTKGVSEEQIIAELCEGTGIAAYDSDGNPAGYIAVRSYGLLDEVAPVPSDESVTLKKVPHFGIGSLVVHPDHRGKGLADTLIWSAAISIRSRLLASETMARFAMASAIAAPTSQRLFLRTRFWATHNPDIAAAHGYTADNPLLGNKQLMNSIVLVR